MSDEPKKGSRVWLSSAAIALLLIAGGVFFVWAFTAAENGGGYFNAPHVSG